MLFTNPFKFLCSHDLFGAQESYEFVVDTINARDKPCSQDDLVLEELAISISNFGKRCTLNGLK